MITTHTETHCTLWDGESEHVIAHEAFDRMKPHAAGGMHPACTEAHHGWLPAPPHAELTDCPVTPVAVTVDDPRRPGKQATVTMLPINAYLQAYYGPEGQIVTVPINGDANAQRLHWLKRNEAERAEMRAVLRWLGAWRLADDGTVPEGAS